MVTLRFPVPIPSKTFIFGCGVTNIPVVTAQQLQGNVLALAVSPLPVVFQIKDM
jgi:hypothetical protein